MTAVARTGSSTDQRHVSAPPAISCVAKLTKHLPFFPEEHFSHGCSRGSASDSNAVGMRSGAWPTSCAHFRSTSCGSRAVEDRVVVAVEDSTHVFFESFANETSTPDLAARDYVRRSPGALDQSRFAHSFTHPDYSENDTYSDAVESPELDASSEGAPTFPRHFYPVLEHGAGEHAPFLRDAAFASVAAPTLEDEHAPPVAAVLAAVFAGLPTELPQPPLLEGVIATMQAEIQDLERQVNRHSQASCPRVRKQQACQQACGRWKCGDGMCNFAARKLLPRARGAPEPASLPPGRANEGKSERTDRSSSKPPRSARCQTGRGSRISPARAVSPSHRHATQCDNPSRSVTAGRKGSTKTRRPCRSTAKKDAASAPIAMITALQKLVATSASEKNWERMWGGPEREVLLAAAGVGNPQEIRELAVAALKNLTLAPGNKECMWGEVRLRAALIDAWDPCSSAGAQMGTDALGALFSLSVAPANLEWMQNDSRLLEALAGVAGSENLAEAEMQAHALAVLARMAEPRSRRDRLSANSHLRKALARAALYAPDVTSRIEAIAILFRFAAKAGPAREVLRQDAQVRTALACEAMKRGAEEEHARSLALAALECLCRDVPQNHLLWRDEMARRSLLAAALSPQSPANCRALGMESLVSWASNDALRQSLWLSADARRAVVEAMAVQESPALRERAVDVLQELAHEPKVRLQLWNERPLRAALLTRLQTAKNRM